MGKRDKFSAEHQALADAYIERTKNLPALLTFEVKPGGGCDLKNQSPYAIAVWMELLNLDHAEQLELVFNQVGNLSPSTEQMPATLNRALATIIGMKPRDSTETMLCTQMFAINAAMMRIAGQAPSTFEASGLQSNAISKLARTFTAQVEALTRYRARGQQSIKVEHIHVHEGGQVAVGNFGPRGRGGHKSEDQPHVRSETTELPERPAMLGHVETIGVTLSGAGNDGLERLPISRRNGRGSDR
jgi:hypothetical protein